MLFVMQVARKEQKQRVGIEEKAEQRLRKATKDVYKLRKSTSSQPEVLFRYACKPCCDCDWLCGVTLSVNVDFVVFISATFDLFDIRTK